MFFFLLFQFTSFSSLFQHLVTVKQKHKKTKNHLKLNVLMPTNEKLFGWRTSEESKTSFSSFKFEIPDDILASLLFELLMRYLFTLVRRKISSACLCLRSKIMTKKQNWWNDSGARPQVQQTFHNNSEQEGTDAGGTDDTHPDEPMVLTQLLSQKTTWWLNWEVHKMSTDRNKTNRAADWIHDSTVITNFSKLQFTVQWLPKLTCMAVVGVVLDFCIYMQPGSVEMPDVNLIQMRCFGQEKGRTVRSSETPVRLRSPSGGCFLTIILHFNASLAALYSRGDERRNPVKNNV